jgi:hypothetical protein
MKKGILFIVLITSFSSCINTWNEEDKAAFHEACMDEAKAWAGTEARAKTYCDCVFEKMEKKYPNENDALAHISDLAHDTALLQCRRGLQ